MKKIKLLLALAVMAFGMNAYCYDNQTYGELGQAIYKNDAVKVQQLLDSGVSPNEMQEQITPLGIALEWKKTKCVAVLLAHPSIDINQTYSVITTGGAGSVKKRNALISAVDNYLVDEAQQLLDMGADANFVTTEYDLSNNFEGDATALTLIYYKDKNAKTVALAQSIADKTTDINKVFSYSQYTTEQMDSQSDISLLMRLIGQGNEERSILNSVTISLMDRGANFKQYFEITQKGTELLAQYMSKEDYATYQKNQKYVSYTCALLSAAVAGNSELMQYMIENGASYERYDDEGGVIFSACKNTACIEVMLAQGLNVNTTHPSGMPVLLSAVTAENYDVLDGLLKHGADAFVAVNGSTVSDFIKTYPSSRKKKVVKLYKTYGYTL